MNIMCLVDVLYYMTMVEYYVIEINMSLCICWEITRGSGQKAAGWCTDQWVVGSVCWGR